jgi:hypothetical protein
MATPGIDQPQDQLQGGPADRIREAAAARQIIREAAVRQLARAAAATEEVATSSSQDGHVHNTQVKCAIDDRSYIAF